MKVFLKNFLFNLAILIGIGLILFIAYPEWMKGIYEVYALLFGPLAILMVIVTAFPQRRRP